MNIPGVRRLNRRLSCLTRPNAGPRRRPAARRLHFEPLEARQLLDGMGWQSFPYLGGGVGTRIADLVVAPEEGLVYTLGKTYVPLVVPAGEEPVDEAKVVVSVVDAGSGGKIGEDFVVVTDAEGIEYTANCLSLREMAQPSDVDKVLRVVGGQKAVIGPMAADRINFSALWFVRGGSHKPGELTITEQIDPDVAGWDDVTVAADGTVCALGQAYDAFGDPSILAVKKWDPQGKEIWKETVGIPGGYVGAARGLTMSEATGEVYFAANVEFGESLEVVGVDHWGYREPPIAFDSAIFLGKISSDGSEVTGALVNGSSSDSVSEICLDDDGNVLFVGTTYSADYPRTSRTDPVPTEPCPKAAWGILDAGLRRLKQSATLGNPTDQVAGDSISWSKKEIVPGKTQSFTDVGIRRVVGTGQRRLEVLDMYRLDQSYALVKKEAVRRMAAGGFELGKHITSASGTSLYSIGGTGLDRAAAAAQMAITPLGTPRSSPGHLNCRVGQHELAPHGAPVSPR